MADVLTENGDVPKYSPQILKDSDPRIVVQQVKAYLQLHEGEFIIDPSKGFPWKRWFTQKPLPLGEITGVVPRELEAEIDGLDEVRNFTGDFNPETGVVSFEGAVVPVSTDGEEQESIQIEVVLPDFHPIIV